MNFNEIKHRSIESATDDNLLVNISSLTLIPKLFTIIGIIFEVIFSLLFFFNFWVWLSYIFSFIGAIFLFFGIYMFFTLKFKFNFHFEGDNLNFTKSGFFFPDNKIYLISKLDYIIIDQMHVENDDGNQNGQSVSIGDDQNGIPTKIIINSIDEGYDEIFSGSGDPPLFTNDEVEFFNQYMKDHINTKT